MLHGKASTWEEVLDRKKHVQDVVNNSGADLFGSDVPEDRVRYITGFVFSNTIGSAQTLNVDKIDENDSAVGFLSGVNIGANADVRFTMGDDEGILPHRIEGGTNLNLDPSASAIGVTTFYYDNEMS